MTNEEFKEVKSRELWEQMINNENIKSELDNLEIDSFDAFMARQVLRDISHDDPPFLKEFSLKNLETLASLKLSYIPKEHLSIQISYCGQNIMGWSVMPRIGEGESIWYSVYSSLGALFQRDCSSGFYVAAVDKDKPETERVREYLRGATSLSSYSQIYARFNLAAAYVGKDLVNKALIAADCLTLDELKELAEADSFQDQDSV